MRKTFVVAIVIVPFLFGCFSLDTRQAKTPRYSVEHKEFDDIRNPFTTDTMLFYKDTLYEVGLRKWTASKEVAYSLMIVYVGSGWLFIPGDVLIQVDENLFGITDDKPSRRVLSGGHVEETIHAYLSAKNIQEMANASLLKIQFFGQPITVTETGIQMIKSFFTDYVAEH